MGSTLHCAIVAKGPKILAYFVENGTPEDAEERASKIIGNAPALHSRYSYTIDDCIICYLMDAEATYCCCMDTRIKSKKQAFATLENLRDHFNALRKIYRDEDVQLDGVVLKNLLRARRSSSCTVQLSTSPSPSSPSPSTSSPDGDEVPLMKSSFDRRWSSSSELARTKSSKHNNNEAAIVLEMGNISNCSSSAGSVEHEQNSSSKNNSKRSLPVQFWCQGLKLIFVVNIVLCILLVGIYFAVCRGIRCE